MSEVYLDTSKSVMISSPAGSGKTEKLARRYIGLLKASPEVERILCITFTEKAAAEMKERILRILKDEEPSLYGRIKERIPLMRISTMHAFCLRLLKRFSMELGIDPSLGVTDEMSSANLWSESIYEVLMDERQCPSDFFNLIIASGIKGFSTVKKYLDALHAKSVQVEMLNKSGGNPTGNAADTALLILGLYIKCLQKYKSKKARRGELDYDDMEVLAYEALSKDSEWQNILYAFDERTDHILVDEFQDTSTLQWMIIQKLTEEWRSGQGAKRSMGIVPTIFLVGDEKQSIYLFRGANAAVFKEAKEELKKWMGEDFRFQYEVRNFRSLPAITDFTNALFEKIMPADPPEKWMTPYEKFMSERTGEGKVELILHGQGGSMRSVRESEFGSLAQHIRSSHNTREIYKDGKLTKCEYSNMAILLRKRTHLSLLEHSLRQSGIPFIVMKGIGFFEETEVAMLRELISFLADTSDNYSLFCVLRSPLFSIGYKSIALMKENSTSLWDYLLTHKPLSPKLNKAGSVLMQAVQSYKTKPLAVVLEQALLNCGAWESLRERQRTANVRKFISLIESFEAGGLSIIEIREKLLRLKDKTNVPKANVNDPSVNAVRIMTIHAAKGLQFPMVFLPSMEDGLSPKSGPIVLEGNSVYFQKDSDIRKKDEHFRIAKKKEEEESKRLFYVAVTRAQDYLCMLGTLINGKAKGWLGYLDDAFDIFNDGNDAPLEIIRKDPGIILHAQISDSPDTARTFGAPVRTEPLDYKPHTAWIDVTSETPEGRGSDQRWTQAGAVMHRLFEELSNGMVAPSGIFERLQRLLMEYDLRSDDISDKILADIDKLRASKILDEIIMPSKGAYAELPFVYQKGQNAYRGRIDRMIIRDNIGHIYDYKTFPLDESDIPYYIEHYGFQMRLYKEAAEALFKIKCKSHLIFTHLPIICEVDYFI